MSTVYLDRDRIAPFEPEEVVGNRRASLSPWAIPQTVIVNLGDGGGVSIQLTYPGGEPARPAELLDVDTPSVFVTVSQHTRKVLSLESPAMVDPSPLRALAARLAFGAETEEAPGRRMSYRLTAKLLVDIADQMERSPPTAAD